MARFNKKEYKAYYKFVTELISSRPWCVDCDYGEWVNSFLPLYRDTIIDENYEAAQAFKDAVRDVTNKLAGKEVIKSDDIFVLPDLNAVPYFNARH